MLLRRLLAGGCNGVEYYFQGPEIAMPHDAFNPEFPFCLSGANQFTPICLLELQQTPVSLFPVIFQTAVVLVVD